MILDVNGWLGTWPFRALRDTTPEAFVARMDRAGIDMACVSFLEAIFHRNVQPANERLAEAVHPWRDRLLPMATINPAYPAWEDDLRACAETFAMRGVRLFPVYHGYAIDGPEARKAVAACAERGLPVSIPFRMEDARERHHLDPGRTVNLGAIANLIAAVDGAIGIVPNCRGFAGSPLATRDDLREREWYFDLSLTEVSYNLSRDPSAANELGGLLAAGGARHLLFGTHAPLSYVAPALVKLAILPVDEATREDISGKTAARLFLGR